ncbi:hypothetical protein GCM10023259_089530 [Thermocatellispora tengchongensis]
MAARVPRDGEATLVVAGDLRTLTSRAEGMPGVVLDVPVGEEAVVPHKVQPRVLAGLLPRRLRRRRLRRRRLRRRRNGRGPAG